MSNIFQNLAKSRKIGEALLLAAETGTVVSDYTEWQKDHLFVGETVESLVGQIRAFEKEREASHGV